MIKKFIKYAYNNFMYVVTSAEGIAIICVMNVPIALTSLIMGIGELTLMKSPDIFNVLYQIVLFPIIILLWFNGLFFLIFLTQQLFFFIVRSITNKIIKKD